MPHIVHRDDLAPISSDEVVYRKYDLLGDEQTQLVGANFELCVLNPGEITLQHFHEAGEHYIFVLRGEGSLELEGESHPIAQNYVISIDPGERHAVRNTGEDMMELLEFLITQ